jgi:acyl-CoA thioester hydrolase
MDGATGLEAFELTIRVAAADVDQLGHVNNTVYLRWVQDVAIAHWQVLATPSLQAEIVWMVLRHEIDYKQPAWPDDELVLRTWVGEADGLRFDRHTQVLRAVPRVLLAQARTVWCPIDVRTGRPKRLPPAVRQLVSRPNPTQAR